MSRIVLTGDSHLGAIKRAQDSGDDPRLADIDFLPLGVGSVSLTDFFQVDQAARNVKVTHKKWNNVTFSQQMLNNNEGLKLLVLSLPINSTRLLREHSWHRHVPWRLKKHDREIPLSDAVIRTIIEQDCTKSIEFAKALHMVGIKVAVMEGPRFFTDAPHLARKRVEVCADIEQRCREFAHAQIQNANIPLIKQPAKTIDPAGNTKAEFRHIAPKDFTHGNAAYGQLAGAAILDVASKINESSPGL
jgi:hypothetical protein